MKKCNNSFIFKFNDLKSTGYRCKVIEKHYSIKFLSVIGNLLWCLAQKWAKSLSFRLKIYDVTVPLSLVVLS